MPPKRAMNRRDGPVARSNDNGTRSYLAEISGPQATNPNLPNIPAKPSWGYGSSTAPVFPRQLSIKSGMNVDDMAESIESGVKSAQDRDENGQENPPKTNPKPRANSRQTRRSVSASVSPRRRRRREPTPDQVQLLGTLRESTVSPNPRAGDGLSTATPSPPVPHAISTESSPPPVPPYPTLPSAEPLYPSPLLRLDSTARQGAPRGGSPQQEDNLDNESVISWNVERDIHEDDLQRTRPARFREERQGKNLTAPPRRFSGLAFPNETIQEEDEPESEGSVKNSPTPEPALEPQDQSDTQPRAPSEPQLEPEPALAPESTPEPEPSTAPTRTIIPRTNLRETSSPGVSPSSPVQSVKAAVKSGVQSIPTPSFSFRQSQVTRIAAILILTILSILTVFTFSGDLANIPSGIRSRLPFGRQSPYIPLNGTAMDAIHSLSKHVARIDTRVSSLSGEVATVRSEVENMPPSTTVVEPVPVWKATPTPKINFLAQSMGVKIDPQKTSPTVGLPSNFFERATHRLMEPATSLVRWVLSFPEPLGPLAALTHWEDAGDCWCSTPDSGVSQLSVILGLPIIPEDVAVEHISKGATADPGSAPKEMELWAHYVVRNEDSATKRSWVPSFLSSLKGSSKRSESTGFSDQFLPREKIMEALHIAYRGEPDASFSDDELLGPTFYRIGRWMYDINSPELVQDSSLAAVIDSPDIKVDHVFSKHNYTLESNSGFTHDGNGADARINVPNFCNRAKTSVPPPATISACAVNVQVQPDEACQEGIKNYRTGVSFSFKDVSKGTYRIDKGTEVEEHSVKGDDAGGLEGIAVDDVAARHGVSDLDSRGDCAGHHLTDHPVIVLVDADAPDNQTDYLKQDTPAKASSQPREHSHSSSPTDRQASRSTSLSSRFQIPASQ